MRPARDKNQLQEFFATLRRELPRIKAAYQVKSLAVFGSYARGDQVHNSDLDLLVEFHRPPTLFQFVRLRRRLASAFGRDVDLVMRSALKPNIGKHILRESFGGGSSSNY